jgi:hypothetical protein
MEKRRYLGSRRGFFKLHDFDVWVRTTYGHPSPVSLEEAGRANEV